MSQISQYVKQSEALVALFSSISIDIERIKEVDADSINDWSEIVKIDERINKYYKEINHLQEETGVKLLEKLEQVDPVTKEKRYGAQTRQKFQVSYESVQQTIDQLFPLYQQHQAHYQQLSTTFTSKLSEEEQEQSKMSEEAARQRVLEEQRRKVAEEEERRKQKQLEHEEEQRLHQQAELVRKRKLEETQNLQVFINQVNQTLQQKVQQLNQQLSYEKTLIAEYVGYIKSFCQENSTQFPLRAVKQMILENIFNRIVGKPDDVNARKLRVTHPVLQKKLTAVRGAIQLLVIAGFELRLKPHLETSAAPLPAATGKTNAIEQSSEQNHSITTENRAVYEQALAQLEQCRLQDALLPAFTPLLFPHTQWELFLEMDEPAIDDIISVPSTASTDLTVKKMSWIEWYDAVKEYADVVKAELS